MSQELHYTSVPRGLKPGSRGFCTVASTPRMSGALTELLESLSGYQQVYSVNDPAAAQNPINYSHLKSRVGGLSVSILSRVGPAELDYSGRSNKYAHHIILDANERPEGGPAWLMSQPGFLQTVWSGEPQVLPGGRKPPQGDHASGIAKAWHSLTGDAGWAGVLAESFLADPRRLALLVFRPGMNLLPLFVEAIALLPPSKRWEVEFSTYFTTLPRGLNCPWRGVLKGSPEAENALRLPNVLVINLGEPLGQAEGRTLVDQARDGKRREPPGGGEASTASRTGSRGSAAVAGRPIRTAGVPPQAPPPGLAIPNLSGRPSKRQPGLSWVVVAGIVAASLLGMGGSGFILFQFLQRTNSALPNGEARTKTEVATKAEPKPESPVVATKPAEQTKRPRQERPRHEGGNAGGQPTRTGSQNQLIHQGQPGARLSQERQGELAGQSPAAPAKKGDHETRSRQDGRKGPADKTQPRSKPQVLRRHPNREPKRPAQAPDAARDNP